MSEASVSNPIIGSDGITRRGFLKTTAALVGTSALIGSAASSRALAEQGPVQESGEQVFSGYCRGNCLGGCALDIHVRDGRVARVAPHIFADDDGTGMSRICTRGITHPQRIYDPNRLKYPMKRVGERGAGEFERISWEEAISTICEKWKGYREQYGDSSIAQWYLAGNDGALHGFLGSAWRRFTRAMQASSIMTGADYSGIYMNSLTIGDSATFGPWNEAPTLREAKHIFIWGTNPVESRPHDWRFILDAQDNGCKVTAIDPICTMSASRADRYIPIRANSDTALAMACCRIVIEEELTDDAFLKKATVAPFLVKESDGTYLHMSDLGVPPTEGPVDAKTGKPTVIDPIVVWDEVTGAPCAASSTKTPAIWGNHTIDGIKVATALEKLKERVDEWTPERAAEVCGMTVDDVYEIAHDVADGPSCIYTSFGFGHAGNSHPMYLSTAALLMLTGNLGKPGTSNGVCKSAAKCISMKYFVVPGKNNGPQYYVSELPTIMETGKYGDKDAVIKSVYVYSGNVIGNTAGKAKMLEAIKKIDFIVVTDMRMTDTVKWADIVLPCAHWFEVNDISTRAITPYVILQEKCAEPLYEAKSDLDICKLLADGMGFESLYPDDDLTMLENIVNWSNFKGWSADSAITWDRVKREKCVRCRPEGWCDGADGVFGTATKKAQFYLEKPTPRLDHGQKIDVEKERLPYFEPPFEAWPTSVDKFEKNPLADKYPIVFVQFHGRWSTHTQFRETPWIREIKPEPIIHVSVEDAAERGISNRDVVRVFNDRGAFKVKAVIDPSMPKGMANLPHGCMEDMFIEGHYQYVTDSSENVVCSNENYSDCLIQIEKA